MMLWSGWPKDEESRPSPYHLDRQGFPGYQLEVLDIVGKQTDRAMPSPSNEALPSLRNVNRGGFTTLRHVVFHAAISELQAVQVLTAADPSASGPSRACLRA